MKKRIWWITGLCLLPATLFALGMREKPAAVPAEKSSEYNGVVYELEPADNGRVIITVLIEKNGDKFQAIRHWTTRSRINVDVYGPAASQLSMYEGEVIHLVGNYSPGEKNPWYGELFEAELYTEN